MRTKIQLRELTPEERVSIEKLARSRTEEARLVERAQIILGLADGERPSHLAGRLRITRPKVYRSRIDEILAAEGLRWRQQEGWFGERVDPDFAEKRGASKPSTPFRLKEAR